METVFSRVAHSLYWHNSANCFDTLYFADSSHGFLIKLIVNYTDQKKLKQINNDRLIWLLGLTSILCDKIINDERMIRGELIIF